MSASALEGGVECGETALFHPTLPLIDANSPPACPGSWPRTCPGASPVVSAFFC